MCVHCRQGEWTAKEQGSGDHTGRSHHDGCSSIYWTYEDFVDQCSEWTLVSVRFVTVLRSQCYPSQYLRCNAGIGIASGTFHAVSSEELLVHLFYLEKAARNGVCVSIS